MKISKLVLSTASALLLALPAMAQESTWKIDPAHSSVNFEIRHLGVSNVRGAFTGVNGTVVWNEKDVSKSHVDSVIDATSVSTNNDKRDGHLKSPDFFDVEKNPTLTFKSTSVKRVKGKLQLVGDLTLAGQTKSVTLDVDGPSAPQTGQGGKVVSGFSASGILKRSDFGFGAKFTPPSLGDEVKFTIDLEVDKQ